MICPICKTENTDNWPVEVDGKIVDGGCQACWEDYCDKKYWEAVGSKMEHTTIKKINKKKY